MRYTLKAHPVKYDWQRLKNGGGTSTYRRQEFDFRIRWRHRYGITEDPSNAEDERDFMDIGRRIRGRLKEIKRGRGGISVDIEAVKIT